jgi:hypothetical protein
LVFLNRFEANFEYQELDVLSLPLIASLSPMMKRGKFLKNAPLLRSFFLFSSVKLSMDFFETVRNESEMSCEYGVRVGLIQKPEPNDHPEQMEAFDVKSKLLRETCVKLCNRQCSRLFVETFVAHCWGRILDIGKPKKKFYFLRLLRCCFFYPFATERFRETTRQSLIDSEFLLGSGLTPICEREFYEVLRSAGLFERLSPNTAQFLSIYGQHHFGALVQRKVPSDVLFVLRSLLRSSSSLWGSFESRVCYFIENPIIGIDLIQLVSNHPELVQDPTPYLKVVLSSTSPLAGLAKPTFVSILLVRFPDIRPHFNGRVQQMIGERKSLPNVIEYASAFFQIQSQRYDQSSRRVLANKAQEVETTQNLFLVALTVDAAVSFARVLAANASACDCVQLLLAGFAVANLRFMVIFVLTRRFFTAVDSGVRETFAKALKSAQFPYDSRARALRMLLEEPPQVDAAFLMAMHDTSDKEMLDAICDEYKQ